MPRVAPWQVLARLGRAVEGASRAASAAGRARPRTRQMRRSRSRWYVDTWTAAAEAVGAEAEPLADRLISIRRGSARTWVRESTTDLDGPATLRVAGDKALSYRLLTKAGIPVPPHVVFSVGDLDPVIDFLGVHDSLVVKPSRGTGAGAGVTANVSTRRRLALAAARAAGHSAELLAEAQVPGANLRVLVLDGEMVEAVERRPPTVTGDGSTTVRQLISDANDRRRSEGTDRAQALIEVDLDTRFALEQASLSLDAVPAAEQVVRLKTVISQNQRDDNIVVTDCLHPGTVEVALAAAAALGVRLAGVDVIIDDVTADLRDGSGVVLEVNTTPGLYHHQGPDRNRVAARILEACLTEAETRARETA